MIIEQLRQLKESSGFSNQRISEISGVPLSTVNRILSGQTENPSFDSIAAIVKAMNGSLDSIGSIERNHENLYERIISNKNKWIVRLFCFSCFMVLENIIILIIFITK